MNSRAQLAQLTAIARDRINEHWMAEGVTFIDPAQAWIGPDATIGRDTVVWPQTHLIGECHIGTDCQLGPNSRLTNTSAGNGCIIDETVAIDAKLENAVDCGPRAYLRPGTHMLNGSKAGTHVEIKKSTIGEGSKVPHLSYIGDTTMGSGVNMGAGSITCNYDGVHKHKTVIGNDVFVGSDTMIVAPGEIGDGALVAAGYRHHQARLRRRARHRPRPPDRDRRLGFEALRGSSRTEIRQSTAAASTRGGLYEVP